MERDEPMRRALVSAQNPPRPRRAAFLGAVALAAWWALPISAQSETAPASPPRPVPLGDVTLDSLSFHGRATTLTIPHVEARGTALTAEELRDILDPSSRLTPAQRAARLSAASLAMPSMTLSADPDPKELHGWSVTAHDVLLTDVVAGKAAALTVRAIDGQFEADPGQRGEIATGAVAAHAVDAALMAAVATGKRDDPALPLVPLFSDLSVAGERLSAEDVTVTLDRLDYGPLEARPPLLPWPELAASIGDAGGDTPATGQDRLPAALLDAASSFKFDRFAMAGLKASDAGIPTFTAALRSLTAEDLNLFRIGSAKLDGFSLDAPTVQVTLDQLNLTGIGRGSLYEQILAATSGGFFNPKGLDASPGGNSAVALAGLDVALRTTAADGPFPIGTINTVHVPMLDIGQAVSPDATHIDGHANVTVQYHIPPSGTGRDLQDLRDAGLSFLDLTFGYRLSYDAGTRSLDLADLTVDGKGLGAASMSARVDDVGPFAPGQKFTASQFSDRLGDSVFHGLTATVVDRGLIGTALPVLARRAGSTPAGYKAGLKATIDQQVAGILGPAAAERIGSAVAALLEGPGTMAITVTPPPGLTFRAIGAADPATLGRDLDIAAKTRR